MACRELAALRLGLMGLLGVEDEAQRQHDLAELGPASEEPGPLRSLSEARSLQAMLAYYQATLADLEEQVARMPSTDPKLPYYRSLLLVNRRVEQDLASRRREFEHLWRDLDALHDLIHEVHPAGA